MCPFTLERRDGNTLQVQVRPYLPFVAANEVGQLLVLRSWTKRRKELIWCVLRLEVNSGITEISVYEVVSMSMGSVNGGSAASWVAAKNSNNAGCGEELGRVGQLNIGPMGTLQNLKEARI